jgi:DNA-binding transcriptional MerR regulator
MGVVRLTLSKVTPYVSIDTFWVMPVADQDEQNKPSQIPSPEGLTEALATDGLTTGDMARLSKTTLRTVRFYEQQGLIASMAREGGCHRKFAPTELRKLQMISDLREGGLSLPEIKALMGLKRRCNTPVTAACQMSEALSRCVKGLQERIDTLARLRNELVSTLTAIQRCRDCREPEFPARCSECDVTNQPDTSRATKLLWKN